MLTFQDFQENRDVIAFIERALAEHAADPRVRMAQIADEYDRQRNTTVMNYAKMLYEMDGQMLEDRTASTNRIASNFFHRLNTQRNTYLLGNGVFFQEKKTKELLGDSFDTVMKRIGYNALKHGVSYGIWNNDRLYNFTIHEFMGFPDENTSAIRAGIRFWRLAPNKPRCVTLYEEDGYTEFADNGDKKLVQIAEKRAYRERIAHTELGGDEIIGYDNYSALPIIPMYGSYLQQSTLVGLRAKIDAYDLIASGFANDLDDCAEIYWLLGNAGGMDDADMAQFRDRLRLQHIAKVDRDQTVTPYTQEIPYTARKEFLDIIRAGIYEDFGGLDVHAVAAGATNDHIEAAYQPLDEEADDFEFQCTDFIKQVLTLIGVEDEPTYKRNRISNQSETVSMVMQAATYLDAETVLKKLPFVTVDEVQDILNRKDKEDVDRFAGIQQQSEEPGDLND